MRFYLGLAVLLVSTTVAAKPSNPAFLGVGMHDAGGTRGAGPCVIDTITKDSGAHVAGLRTSDVFVALDGASVPDCNALITLIQAREAGDIVKLDVRRSGVATSIKAQLLSRAEVLRQRFVGQPVPLTTLTRVDDQTKNDLTSRGKTTIIGWFDQKNCVGCETVFGSVVQWSRKLKSNSIAVLGATAGDIDNQDTVALLKQYQRGLDVPLLIADPDTFSNFTITDSDRIHFMVIDCRGVVQYAAPLAPDSDDKAAALDELYAAAEQASRRMK